MPSAINARANTPYASKTVFPDNSAHTSIAEARRLQALRCFEEHEKLAVLDSILILVLSGQNIDIEASAKRPKNGTVKQYQKRDSLPNRKSRPNNRQPETFAEVIEVDGIQYEVLNSEGQGIYADRFERMVRQLNTAIELWNRVMCFRLDLHTKLELLGGEDIRRFIKSLNKRLRTKYTGFKSLGYCWACEVGSKSKRRHYHLVLMVNGNLVQGCGAVHWNHNLFTVHYVITLYTSR